MSTVQYISSSLNMVYGSHLPCPARGPGGCSLGTFVIIALFNNLFSITAPAKYLYPEVAQWVADLHLALQKIQHISKTRFLPVCIYKYMYIRIG